MSALRQGTQWLSDVGALLQLQPEPFLLYLNFPVLCPVGDTLSPHIPSLRQPAHCVLWALIH